MKTLVLVFHPDMSASRANRPLAAKAETLGNDVTVRYMYDIYPDQKVDVAAEQAALEAAEAYKAMDERRAIKVLLEP